MPTLLDEGDVDTIGEQVDLELTKVEEDAVARQFTKTENVGDLSDGGMVNGARLSPMSGGRKLERGRASARGAWMWNGTESVLPLTWNPDGTEHDYGRRYLTKRHCLCCHNAGFRGVQCPNCVKNNCTSCGGSTNRAKIIANFYLKAGDVPFPTKFYGIIPCFLPDCIRRGDRGFLTEQDMRLHARSRHRMEYQAHIESMEAGKVDEVAELRRRLDAMILQSQPPRYVGALETQAPIEAVTPLRPRPAAGKRKAKSSWSPKRRAEASRRAKERIAASNTQA